jgi:hypothetical protein
MPLSSGGLSDPDDTGTDVEGRSHAAQNTADDVEGHVRGLRDADDDVEGHQTAYKNADELDTEGHGGGGFTRSSDEPGADDEDVQGHMTER